MKIVIALLLVAIVAVAALGGYYLYDQYQNKVGEAQMVEAQSSAPSITMGEMKKPENDADVMDNLDAAIKANRDTIAWMEIPNTDISNTVMQGMDNLYYERRDEHKKDDIYGCYFFDAECPVGTRDEFALNTVVYGHSDLKDNPDGPRFSQLFRFTDLAFAQKTPYIYLTTQEGKTTWQIFAAFYTDTKLDYIRVHMEPEEALKLATEAAGLSVFDYGITPKQGDKLLTLSTCSIKNGADGTNRFVVMARMLPEGAEEQKTIALKEK